MNIVEECPEFNYFRITVEMQGGHKKELGPHIVTLESSLGLKSLISMGFKVTAIDPIDKNRETSTIRDNFNWLGVYFAETTSYYKPDDFDRLKEDYFISKITGLKQGTL